MTAFNLILPTFPFLVLSCVLICSPKTVRNLQDYYCNCIHVSLYSSSELTIWSPKFEHNHRHIKSLDAQYRNGQQSLNLLYDKANQHKNITFETPSSRKPLKSLSSKSFSLLNKRTFCCKPMHSQQKLTIYHASDFTAEDTQAISLVEKLDKNINLVSSTYGLLSLPTEKKKQVSNLLQSKPKGRILGGLSMTSQGQTTQNSEVLSSNTEVQHNRKIFTTQRDYRFPPDILLETIDTQYSGSSGAKAIVRSSVDFIKIPAVLNLTNTLT